MKIELVFGQRAKRKWINFQVFIIIPHNFYRKIFAFYQFTVFIQVD